MYKVKQWLIGNVKRNNTLWYISFVQLYVEQSQMKFSVFTSWAPVRESLILRTDIVVPGCMLAVARETATRQGWWQQASALRALRWEESAEESRATTDQCL